MNTKEKIGAKTAKNIGAGKLLKNAGGTVAKQAISAVDLLGLVKDMHNGYMSLCETREVHKTERDRIAADRDVTLKRIVAQKAAMILYMEGTFAERATNFRQLFSMADAALKAGDADKLALVMTSVTEIAKTSPLKDLLTVQDTERALKDPNKVWDI